MTSTIIAIKDLSKAYAPKNPIISGKEAIIKGLGGYDQDWKTRAISWKKLYISDNLEGGAHHKNFMNYLGTAWANHYGIQVSPDIIWFSLLCEMAELVNEAPDIHEHLFTTTPGEKQKILVYSDSMTVLPLEPIMAELRKRVPTDVDIFLPEFSTTEHPARLAKYAAFADMVSPFYSYMMYCCGIPSVEILGSLDDYAKMEERWATILKVVGNAWSKLTKWTEAVTGILGNMVRRHGDTDFWKDIYRVTTCGSGSQEVISGWFSRLHRKVPSRAFEHNFSTHQAKVAYEQVNTRKHYEMFHGIMSSHLRGPDSEFPTLVPSFNYAVFEVKPDGSKFEIPLGCEPQLAENVEATAQLAQFNLRKHEEYETLRHRKHEEPSGLTQAANRKLATWAERPSGIVVPRDGDTDAEVAGNLLGAGVPLGNSFFVAGRPIKNGSTLEGKELEVEFQGEHEVLDNTKFWLDKNPDGSVNLPRVKVGLGICVGNTHSIIKGTLAKVNKDTGEVE